MFHEVPGDERNILQVEINTIASSFGALSNKLTDMHNIFNSSIFIRDNYHIPGNNTISGISNALVSAHKKYISVMNADASNVIIIMVVQPNERNFSDQKLIQFECLKTYGVTLLRKTFEELSQSCSLGNTGVLKYKNSEVSLVYYRAGYTPDDYPSNLEWETRKFIEQSIAIKCPNIAYHLVGTKKVQQALAKPGVLEYFLGDNSTTRDYISCLRNVFAGLYSLDVRDEYSSVEDINAMHDALLSPNKYVVKPQREGGGNNYYGDDVTKALTTFSEEDLSAHILMERIFPSENEAIMVRDGVIYKANCLCELGIYSTYLEYNDNVELNDYVGYLLRIKPSDSNEGGVQAGFSVLGVPTLK